MMFGFFSEFFRAILDFFRKLFGIKTEEKEEPRGHFPLKWSVEHDVLFISDEEAPTYADLVFRVELAPGSRSLEISSFCIQLQASHDGVGLLLEENMENVIPVSSSPLWVPRKGENPGTICFGPAKGESVTMVGGEEFRFDLGRVELNPENGPSPVHCFTTMRNDAKDKKQIDLERKVVPEGIKRLSASALKVKAGEEVHLHWRAEGPHHYFLRPAGVLTHDDEVVVKPEKTTTFIVQQQLAPRNYQEASITIEVES